MTLCLNHGEVYFPGIERCSAWRSLVLGGPVGCLGLKMHCRPACRGHRHLSLGTTRPPHRATLRNMRKRRKKRQKSPQREREPCGKVLNWCFHIFCYIRDLLIFPHYLKIKYKAQITETVLTIEQILPVSRLISRQHSYLMFFYIQTWKIALAHFLATKSVTAASYWSCHILWLFSFKESW